eukprot:TRINITY_DN50011_c0_g1_i1.p1 TRINITY_DN50011_c0_g1~~TRINITY_DN50011_c0_g1_i1.p1  ORF type:complete len:458 (-),score=33.13 TRINITY_DN50011_c0_g1_i1:53-1426(-)
MLILILLHLRIVCCSPTTSPRNSSSDGASLYGSTASPPTLKFFALRSGDRPVDTVPHFTPMHFVYKATLDFSSESYAVDAVAETGCKIDVAHSLQATKTVATGAISEASVSVVRQAAVGEVAPAGDSTYTISVNRLDGSEVTIRSLATPGATLSPMFEPSVAEYVVRLPEASDILSLLIVPLDRGQMIGTSIGTSIDGVASKGVEPRPDGNTSTVSPSYAPGVNPNLLPRIPLVKKDYSEHKRRLDEHGGYDTEGGVPPPLAGETQYNVIRRWFPIDMGSSRVVTLVVRPANGDTSRYGKYTLTALRDRCPSNVPLFAPEMGKCVMTCNEGFFHAQRESRCKGCRELCLACSDWDQCYRCVPSEWRLLRFIYRDNGVCHVLQIPWSSIGSIVVGVVVLLACVCCVRCGTSMPRKAPKLRVKRGRHREWDDGEESQRLLRVDNPRGQHEDDADLSPGL